MLSANLLHCWYKPRHCLGPLPTRAHKLVLHKEVVGWEPHTFTQPVGVVFDSVTWLVGSEHGHVGQLWLYKVLLQGSLILQTTTSHAAFWNDLLSDSYALQNSKAVWILSKNQARPSFGNKSIHTYIPRPGPRPIPWEWGYTHTFPYWFPDQSPGSEAAHREVHINNYD